jgi:hypothetical protein
MTWDTVKPAGGNTPAGDDEDAMRHHMTGTVHDFLDDFENVVRNWLPHRFHVVQVFVANCQLN